MIELRVAPYCENCQKFYAVTDMHQQRVFGNDPLKPAGELYTYATVTCEHADQCAAMYELFLKNQKEKKENVSE